MIAVHSDVDIVADVFDFEFQEISNDDPPISFTLTSVVISMSVPFL